MAEAKRKLAAILSADVVGYSQLMHADEAATVATLKEYRAAIARVIERHKGRVVNAPGDNILADFPSAVEAVQGACEIQQVLKGRNLELAPERRMEFRIGVNLGDVIEEADGTIYGDGVNIAARMEALADAGGVCISNTVYDAVEGKLDFGFDFLGAQQVKNIAKPVTVYRVRTEGMGAPAGKVVARWRQSAGLIAAAAVAVLLVAGVAVWQFTRGPELVPQESAAVDDPILALPTGPSIAVLPFENLSGDSEQDYFADGITEEIIAELTRYKELFVIAGSSTRKYRGQEYDPKAVGGELGVRFLVEGNVRRAGEQIRVMAKLLDAGSGESLWAETYERELTPSNIFDLQDEITVAIVNALADPFGGVLALTRLEDTRGRDTDQLDAYECVLRAANYYNILTPEEHFKVRDCLEDAVESDPDYAAALSFLANIYTDEYAFGFNPRPDSLDRALELARRAVELEPSNSLDQWWLARVHYFRHELDEAFYRTDRAIALNPNDATVLAAAATFLYGPGKWERAIALVRKAIALNPNHQGWYHFPLSADHYRKGEYEQALAEAQKINAPGFYWMHMFLAAIYGQMGRQKEARAAVNTLIELYPGFTTETARGEFRKLNYEDNVTDQFIDGLRKAGLPEPPAGPTD